MDLKFKVEAEVNPSSYKRFITFKEVNGMTGIGFRVFKWHGFLLYWYSKKNRPFLTYQNYLTGKTWRV